MSDTPSVPPAKGPDALAADRDALAKGPDPTPIAAAPEPETSEPEHDEKSRGLFGLVRRITADELDKDRSWTVQSKTPYPSVEHDLGATTYHPDELPDLCNLFPAQGYDQRRHDRSHRQDHRAQPRLGRQRT